MWVCVHLGPVPGALRPPPSSWFGRKRIPLPSRGLAGLGPAPRPQLPDSWSPSWSRQKCRRSRTTHAADFRERHGGYIFLFFSHWRSDSLQPNSSAPGSTKLIKIAFSQSSRYGRRGWGFGPFPSSESSTGHVFHLGEGTVALGTITSCHLPLRQCSHSGRDSEGEAACQWGGPIITERNGSLDVKQVTPGQE